MFAELFKKPQGFTLMELLITMVLISILSTLSIASSTYFIEKNEQQRIIDELRTSIQFAKIQAVQLGNPVYLEPLDSNLNWSKGISISTMNKKTHQLDVFNQRQWHHPRWNLSWSGTSSPNRIMLSNNPASAISNGTFHLINIRTQHRVDIVLNRLGRVRIKEEV